MSVLHAINRLNAHRRLLLSLGVAGLTALALPYALDPATRVIAVWLAYSLSYLILCWITLTTAHPRHLNTLTRTQDLGRTVSFLFVILASFSSLFAIVLLFRSGTDGRGSHQQLHILLSAMVVVCSWMLVHTVFTLHYARLYYEGHTKAGSTPKKLDFPGDDEPDYLDFAYFSFVIGMTSQVSDVAIQSKAMRRLALLHGFLAFFFNTSIIALSINTVSNIIGGLAK
ncbi:DUF1345 domain-containing protein [Rudanella lutea]|jgi:uncharacterized membrane protein|uniref:DUF1345 domain-containing protein n=1 Tax=Rudanella lutea TaxID=451374 RepID=UPI000378DB7D|nr:DUF1345 domain-containing protein [Rudanella lutea]